MHRFRFFPHSLSLFTALFFGLTLSLPTLFSQELRVGLIGLDTSHVTAFTEILNNPEAKGHVPGVRVVAAFKGGSPDIQSSWTRVEEYTRTLVTNYGVTLYDSIEAMCEEVDAVLLESVDGRPHLAQAKPVIAARKPLYIDKPMAGSLADVIEIFQLAHANATPVFSASSLRFGKNTLQARAGAVGVVTNAVTSSPAHIESTHPDLFWYGVHGVESLFTVMGTGCASVRRTTNNSGGIQVIGRWYDGRIGTFSEGQGYTGVAHGTRGKMDVGSYDGYAPLVSAIVEFFKTGNPPVSAAETIEIFAFMEAADESKRRNGSEVSLSEVLLPLIKEKP
jgi:predicted dehydrogenase